MAQRREEILAKKAKLAELKKQRELRKAESSQRQSMSGSPAREVEFTLPTLSIDTHGAGNRYYPQHRDEQTNRSVILTHT